MINGLKKPLEQILFHECVTKAAKKSLTGRLCDIQAFL